MIASMPRPNIAEVRPITVESNDLADLARIYEAAVNLCVVHRRPDSGLQEFVEALLRHAPRVEFAAVVRFSRFDFSSLLSEVKYLPGHDFWWRDVALLTGAFCDLFDADRVGLRLRILQKAMCPRFHVDRVPCRMVCTYGGLGTEWLPEAGVNRDKLGRGAQGLPDEESGAIVDERLIETLSAYSVGLLKGDKWEGNEGRGAVHRSPSPTQDKPRRVLLTLDLL